MSKRCLELGVRPSLGPASDCRHDALRESFFATLKCELMDRFISHTKHDSRLAAVCWVETWHNLNKRHSSIGRMSPAK